MVKNILIKFGADWFISVDVVNKVKYGNFYRIQGQIEPIIELIRDLMATYIFTIFGADKLTSIDTRV